MDDFSYDCMQKKRIASGALHRKRGSKSKRCSLSTDYMTESQWKKRNGKVKTMNLNVPIKYDEFVKMPTDLQSEYLQKLITRFGCTQQDFAEILGVSFSTVKRLLKGCDIDRSLFTAGRRKNKEQKAAYDAWMDANTDGGEECVKVEPEHEHEAKIVPKEEFMASVMCSESENANDDPVEDPEKECVQIVANNLMTVPHLDMTFNGVLNIQQIANTILAVAANKTVSVRIIVDEVIVDG